MKQGRFAGTSLTADSVARSVSALYAMHGYLLKEEATAKIVRATKKSVRMRAYRQAREESTR